VSNALLVVEQVRSSANRYFTEQTLGELLSKLAQSPAVGKLIPGYNGVRKMRFPDRIYRRGQRGGLRIIYDYDSNDDVILLYFAYRKTEQSDILPHQRDYIQQIQITDLTEGDLWEIRKN
jgi:mRNA-degrading endonuclease RelE of RelBE toxin-antitoxin system